MVRILILLIMYLISLMTQAQDLDQQNRAPHLSQGDSSVAADNKNPDQLMSDQPILYPETKFDTIRKDLTFENQSAIKNPSYE
jgi:hypothetical protein